MFNSVVLISIEILLDVNDPFPMIVGSVFVVVRRGGFVIGFRGGALGCVVVVVFRGGRVVVRFRCGVVGSLVVVVCRRGVVVARTAVEIQKPH